MNILILQGSPRANGNTAPNGFCDDAWKAIYQYVFAGPVPAGRFSGGL
jgi:hypothetical protein